MLIYSLETVLIDNHLNIRKNIGKMMCLVDYHTLWMTVEKSLGVGLYLSKYVGILQTDIWQIGKQLTTQCGLA